MSVVKISYGRAEIYSDSGCYLRSIGSGRVVDGDSNSKGEVVIVTEDGRVEQYSESGSYVRSIGAGNAVSARISGDTISVRRSDGHVEVYSTSSGCYLRSM